MSLEFATRLGSNQSAHQQGLARLLTDLLHVANEVIILTKKQIIMALIRLYGCTDCSVALLFACSKFRFSRNEAHIEFS